MTKPVYVDSNGPAAEVEAFITKFKIDDEFKPLARLLRRFSRKLVIDDALSAAVPSAFVLANWSVAATGIGGDGFVITVTTLPAANGSAIGLVQYRVGNGSWTDTTIDANGETFAVASDAGTFDIQLRAVNALGAGNASDTKTVTVAAPDAFVLANWSVAENGTDDGFVITVTTLPDNNGSAIDLVQYRVDGGAWTDTTIDANGETFEVASDVGTFDIELRAVNTFGAGATSDTKTVTVAV